jgi:hypothetical protein
MDFIIIILQASNNKKKYKLDAGIPNKDIINFMQCPLLLIFENLMFKMTNNRNF